MLIDLLNKVNARIPRFGNRDPDEKIAFTRRGLNELIGAQVVLLLVVSAVSAFTIDISNTASNAADSAKDTAGDVQQVQIVVNTQRVTLSTEACQRRNDQADALNHVIQQQAEQVIASTAAAKAFAPALEKLGFPPYPELVRQAKRRASELLALKLPLEDCAALKRRLARPTRR